jgi:hypothetical protein
LQVVGAAQQVGRHQDLTEIHQAAGGGRGVDGDLVEIQLLGNSACDGGD